MASTADPVVLDIGSETIKAGLASSFPSDDCPAIVVPSAVQVATADGGTELAPTVQRGQIVDFDRLESLLHHILYGRCGWQHDTEGAVVIAEPLFTPKADREQLCQLLFEQFNVEGLFVHDSAVLSLYAVGKFSGLVADVGHGKLDIAAVMDGATNAAACRRFTHAGQDLNAHLLRLLQQRGAALRDPRRLRDLKHLCAAAADSAAAYDQMVAAGGAAEPQQRFTLPDGQELDLGGSEGQQLLEPLFRPQLLGREAPGVAELATECILLNYDGLGRKAVYDNLLLCGGGSAAAGLQQRFVREMRLLSPLAAQPGGCGVAEYLPQSAQLCAAWSGGAVMARVVQGQNQLMGKGDYEEGGPAAVHRKCA
jgi:actin-related protein 7